MKPLHPSSITQKIEEFNWTDMSIIMWNYFFPHIYKRNFVIFKNVQNDATHPTERESN